VGDSEGAGGAGRGGAVGGTPLCWGGSQGVGGGVRGESTTPTAALTREVL
jgi:hypothetical protein